MAKLRSGDVVTFTPEWVDNCPLVLPVAQDPPIVEFDSTSNIVIGGKQFPNHHLQYSEEVQAFVEAGDLPAQLVTINNLHFFPEQPLDFGREGTILALQLVLVPGP